MIKNIIHNKKLTLILSAVMLAAVIISIICLCKGASSTDVIEGKTNTGLVSYAKAQLGKPYWFGCFGQESSKKLYDVKKEQYPKEYKWKCPKKQLGVKVHDCIGLIKGYLWCDDEKDTTPQYNSAQDLSANAMYEKCTKKGDISSLPEVPGVLVFMPDHVGIYIGHGKVIEARGHDYGVVKAKLKDRDWKTWGYCPYITYK